MRGRVLVGFMYWSMLPSRTGSQSLEVVIFDGRHDQSASFVILSFPVIKNTFGKLSSCDRIGRIQCPYSLSITLYRVLPPQEHLQNHQPKNADMTERHSNVQTAA